MGWRGPDLDRGASVPVTQPGGSEKMEPEKQKLDDRIRAKAIKHASRPLVVLRNSHITPAFSAGAPAPAASPRCGPKPPGTRNPYVVFERSGLRVQVHDVHAKAIGGS